MQVKVNGIGMNCELTGKPNASVVVLSHSLGSSLEMWDPQIGPLSARFRVLRYDTRGHGESEAPKGPYSLDLLAEDVTALMDELGVEKADFVGLSMGGMVGQGLALAHADRFRRFVLCDTTSIIPEEAQPVWQERIERVRREGMQAVADETIERWFTPQFRRLGPPEVEKIRKQLLKTPLEGYLGCIEAIRRLNYLQRLSQIKKPTLIIVGEKDEGTPVDAAMSMHERIGGSRLKVIPSAAHLCNVEQSEAYNEALMDFLGEH